MKYKLKIKIKYKVFMFIPEIVNDTATIRPQFVVKPKLAKSPFFLPGRLALQS